MQVYINTDILTLSAKLNNLNFHPLQFVSLQSQTTEVGESLFIYLNTHFIPNTDLTC